MENSYRTGDEIEMLAESFADISHKTVEYVEEVKRVTAEKERIGTELQMANLIQSSMLPHIFPAFPERQEFDLYADESSMAEAENRLADSAWIRSVIEEERKKYLPAVIPQA